MHANSCIKSGRAFRQKLHCQTVQNYRPHLLNTTKIFAVPLLTFSVLIAHLR